MALKFAIDKLDDVAEPFREHYVKDGDKSYLATQGDHPKVVQFRENNIKLTKEVEELRPLKTKFEGIDPAAVAADRAKLAELAEAKPDARIAELETQLAAEKTARADVE